MAVPNVVVVGGGIAGLSAALSIREAGGSVLVLESAPMAERGGNTRFSNGAMRAVSEEGDPRRLTRERFLADLEKVTQGRTDPVLAELLADESRDTLRWLKGYGVIPYRAAQGTWNQGAQISDVLFSAAEAAGVNVRYEARALTLIETASGISGVEVRTVEGRESVFGDGVILAAGGFEANPEMRARYLGPGWDIVKVRGSRFNTGDGLRMALEAGAVPFGNWSGCHSTNWDLNAPDQNNLELTTVFKRDSFNLGIVVNQRGERFLDEGEDFGGLMYARLGHLILEQPGQRAWQIYDAQSTPMLPPEYHDNRSTRLTADTLESLAAQMDGVDQARLLQTISNYNASIQRDTPFDRTTKDGRGTNGLSPEKSNWATAINQAPFEAFAVTTGITFTFGGVRVDTSGRVLNILGSAIPGLYAAGEMVGGLFYFNYPGGAGLTSAAVFGRLAGAAAVGDSSARQ